MRISQANTLGAGFENNSFIDEVVTMWDEDKARRNRPLFLATGPHTKRARVVVAAPSTNTEPEHAGYQDNDALDGADYIDDEQIPIRTARQHAPASLAAYFGNEDESDSDSYGSN